MSVTVCHDVLSYTVFILLAGYAGDADGSVVDRESLLTLLIRWHHVGVAPVVGHTAGGV